MRKTAKKTLMLFLALTLLLTGCAGVRSGAAQTEEPDPVYDAAIPGTEVKERQPADRVFSLNYDPNASMNPVRAESSANMQFWSLLYDSVFTVNPDWTVSSEVVTDWQSDDFIWWVFHIDTSITFSDGTPLSAEDVAYSIQRAQQSSYYANRLSIIYGISAFGSDTFAVTTQYANSQFPALLNIPIIKKGDYFEDRPLGTGPYMLSEEGDRLVLAPGNRHAAEMPVQTIYLRDCMDTSARIRAFEEAAIDLVVNDPTGMYNLGYGSSNETRYFDTSNMHYIGFNTGSMFFLTAAARCAVGFAIDRETVVTGLMNGCGVPATLPVHPASGLYDEAYARTFAFSPNSASLMFENAAVDDYDHDGKLEMLVTGIVVELNIRFIVNSDSTVKVLAARKICEQLNALGITTTLYELTWADYIEALEKGEFDMYYGEIRLTPDWNLSELFRPRENRSKDLTFQGMNYAQTRDYGYVDLYGKYLAEGDDAARREDFQAISRYVTETGIILPICFERRELLTHRGVATGISATQYDVFHDFNEWTIDLE